MERRYPRARLLVTSHHDVKSESDSALSGALHARTKTEQALSACGCCFSQHMHLVLMALITLPPARNGTASRAFNVSSWLSGGDDLTVAPIYVQAAVQYRREHYLLSRVNRWLPAAAVRAGCDDALVAVSLFGHSVRQHATLFVAMFVRSPRSFYPRPSCT